jgi:hypothetical protein
MHFLKKAQRHALRLGLLFQTKKNFNILDEPALSSFGCQNSYF